jgi:hypothetical protein
MPQADIACASGKVIHYWESLATGQQKPAAGSFIAVMGMPGQSPSSFVKRSKKRKDGDEQWQSITWKPR